MKVIRVCVIAEPVAVKKKRWMVKAKRRITKLDGPLEVGRGDGGDSAKFSCA